jgi:hypothetical protein
MLNPPSSLGSELIGVVGFSIQDILGYYSNFHAEQAGGFNSGLAKNILLNLKLFKPLSERRCLNFLLAPATIKMVFHE